MAVDTRPRVRLEMVCFGIALLDVVGLGMWVWAETLIPQTVFLYGTPSYYVLGLAFLMLGVLGIRVLAHVGHEQWRRPSAMCLWVSTTLLVVPLGSYLLMEVVVLVGASAGGF